MLPRPLRLTKKKDFMILATKGRSIFGPYATLRIVETKKGAKGKIAFIISTKIFKRAVDRNLTKRRSREAVRSLLSEVPPGVNLLFVLKPEARDVEHTKLIEEFKRLMTKVPEALLKPAKPSSRGVKHRSKMGQPKAMNGSSKPQSGIHLTLPSPS